MNNYLSCNQSPYFIVISYLMNIIFQYEYIKVNNLTIENKEVKRDNAKLMHQVNQHANSIEILQHDIDARRRYLWPQYMALE